MVSPILELTNINKSFGHVHANKNINLTINKGTIHGIIGENGAGKSTLMSIVFGLYQANSGTIKINEKEIKLRSPRDSNFARAFLRRQATNGWKFGDHAPVETAWRRSIFKKRRLCKSIIRQTWFWD